MDARERMIRDSFVQDSYIMVQWQVSTCGVDTRGTFLTDIYNDFDVILLKILDWESLEGFNIIKKQEIDNCLTMVIIQDRKGQLYSFSIQISSIIID